MADGESARPRSPLGRAIRVLRAEREVGRGELAARAGVSYTHLADIENGRKSPSPALLAKIAGALGVYPSALLRAAETLEEEGTLTEPSLSVAPVAARRAPPPAAAAPRDARARTAATRPAPAATGHDMTWFEPRRHPAQRGPDGLGELVDAARQLDDPDLRRLIDLARRLADGR